MKAISGLSVPPLIRSIDLTDMVAYAGATWDWHKLHYDTDYASARGLSAPVVDGQYFGALLVQMMNDWLGPGWRPAKMSMRFANPVFPGETVRCEGTVDYAGDDQISCQVRVSVIDSDGQHDRLAVNPALIQMVRRP
ncbi:MaoC family dehydratase [Nocardia sp. NPDC059239]|uniref:MaoC family dehydratase n=1 Tax=Nocardia sp. NPDC059239 TaxID=3346785 RepID=UPI003690981E